jgi:hypothetical protein
MANERLDALLAAYTAERADDTQAVTTFVALLTTSIALLTLIGFALINEERVPGWLIALAPLLPIPFAAYAALVTHIAQIRGRIINRYERDIRALLNSRGGRHSLVPYGHTVLDTAVWEATYSKIVIGLAFIVFFGGYGAVTAACFWYAHDTHFGLAILGLVSSIVAAAVVIILFAVAIWPEPWIRRALDDIRSGESLPPD